ncbi:VOC family protein [Brachybacterium sp. GCM10030267]|uniref:VOC family protein n=1 Tax=unclassified Brachybacterium TaxID=2623841 RepID=UPI003608FA58
MNPVTQVQVSQIQVNLFCEDVEQCLAFYTAFGFAEAFRTPQDGPPTHVEIDAAGTRIGLTSAATANELVRLGVTTPGTPSAEIALWCEDVDAAHERAVSVGARNLVEPTHSPDGRLRFAWVRDPEGHQLKFVQTR